MFVIATEAVPDRLSGYLKRFCLEVQPGVYVGAYPKTIRDRIWSTIEKTRLEGRCVLVYPDSTMMSGFSVQTAGVNRRNPIQKDGIQLVEFHPDTPCD